MSSLKSNIISVLILQGSNYAIPLITFPYLAKTLGVDNYGVFTFIFSVIAYLVLLVEFGFNFLSTKEISANRNNREYINQIFWSTLIFKVILFFLSIILVYIVSLVNEKIFSLRELIFFAMPQLLSFVIFPIFLFQGIGKMINVTISQIIARGLAIPLFFLFVKNDEDLDFAIYIQSLSFLVSSLISIYYVRKENIVLTPKFSIEMISKIFLPSVPFFLGNIAISVYTMSTPIILGLVSTDFELGIYSVAIRIIGVFTGVFSSLNSVFFPRLTYLISNDKKAYYILIRKIVMIEGIISIIFIGLLFLFSSLVINIFFGNIFLPLRSVLFIMLPIILLSPLSVALSNYILIPHGRRDLYYKIPFITGAFHLSYSLFLVNKWGAMGGAVSILLTEVISFILLFIICYQKKYIMSVFKLNY